VHVNTLLKQHAYQHHCLHVFVISMQYTKVTWAMMMIPVQAGMI